MEKRQKRIRGIESKKSFYGRMFILPWEIGMLLFFIIPLIQSLIYSFSYVSIEPGMLATDFVKWDNYKYILFDDQNYTKNLGIAVGTFARSMPIIVIVSLILAMVLNQKFKGRVFFRVIFFLPVIVATGVVMGHLTNNYGGNGPIVQLTTETQNIYTTNGGGINFTAILNSLNFPEDITNEMAKLITNIFNTLWSCGIPVVLFIAGLQTIPEQLYEASKVEGATAWEEFWYITLPMISQTLLLVMVFTMIEQLTQSKNPIMVQAYEMMNVQTNYYESAAMLWFFFAIVGSATALVLFLYTKFLLKRWE